MCAPFTNPDAFDGSSVRDSMLAAIVSALRVPATPPIAFVRSENLPSAFAVSALAAASTASVGAALSAFCVAAGQAPPGLTVDQRLASLWFGKSLSPIGWSLPPQFDTVAGDYAAADGFVRLHTNAPLHKAAALRVLGAPADRDAVAKAVADWPAEALESAVVAAGGCAAQMRTVAAWSDHPQGRAVAREPLVAWSAGTHGRTAHPTGPYLAGVKVLDLTRILAGPVATRTLAGLGATVLRIDPPGWDEPLAAPDVTLGKRCTRLDLKTSDGRAAFLTLLADADILVHGYRRGALEALDLGPDVRATVRPGLIDISLNAYGHTGPWADRRGFDSLVQMSAGIAAAGQAAYGTDRPRPLPVQALDHATGMMMAAAAIEGLRRQRADGLGWRAQLSLARTAQLLAQTLGLPAGAPINATADDFCAADERTPWGNAERLRPSLQLSPHPMHWPLPATNLGAHAPGWE